MAASGDEVSIILKAGGVCSNELLGSPRVCGGEAIQVNGSSVRRERGGGAQRRCIKDSRPQGTRREEGDLCQTLIARCLGERIGLEDNGVGMSG